MEETKAGKGMIIPGDNDAVLNSFVREAFTKEGIFQQWLKGGEGVDHVGFWGRTFQGEFQQVNSPGSRNVWVAMTGWVRRDGDGDTVREATTDFLTHWTSLTFRLNEKGYHRRVLS